MPYLLCVDRVGDKDVTCTVYISLFLEPEKYHMCLEEAQDDMVSSYPGRRIHIHVVND